MTSGLEIRNAGLEAAGVEFTNGHRPGVRMRKALEQDQGMCLHHTGAVRWEPTRCTAHGAAD
jgi:hypothetical protein